MPKEKSHLKDYVNELERKLERSQKKLYDARAELVSTGNQIGYVLKEIGSSPVELSSTYKTIFDTIDISDARNVRELNLKKLIYIVLEATKKSDEVRQFLKKTKTLEKTGLYREIVEILGSSSKQEKLEKKVQEITREANQAINQKEILENIQYDLLRVEAKKKLDELHNLSEGNGKKDISHYVRELNQTLDEKDKTERSRRSALGWNTRYKEEIKKLKQEIKELKRRNS